MIVVIGRVTTTAEHREEFLSLVLESVRASREDPGNLHYDLFESSDAENSFVIVEEWEDDASLQAHFQTPHIGKFMGGLPALIASEPAVHFHTIESTRDLSNVTSG
jgi:quinol monooxygenase YgiN